MHTHINKLTEYSKTGVLEVVLGGGIMIDQHRVFVKTTTIHTTVWTPFSPLRWPFLLWDESIHIGGDRCSGLIRSIARILGKGVLSMREQSMREILRPLMKWKG